jgi:hypothetical protein
MDRLTSGSSPEWRGAPLAAPAEREIPYTGEARRGSEARPADDCVAGRMATGTHLY